MFIIVNKPLWKNPVIKRHDIEGALRACKFLFVDYKSQEKEIRY